MITVLFTDTGVAYNNRALTQYDYNQAIQFQGMEIAGNPQVHFARKGMEAIVKIPTIETETGYITTIIPNSILQYDGEMTVYLYSINASTGKTLQSITFYVNPRQKPEGYTLQPDEPIALSAKFIEENTPGNSIEDRLTALEDAVTKITLSGLGVI
jgi:hypothetical protein